MTENLVNRYHAGLHLKIIFIIIYVLTLSGNFAMTLSHNSLMLCLSTSGHFSKDSNMESVANCM